MGAEDVPPLASKNLSLFFYRLISLLTPLKYKACPTTLADGRSPNPQPILATDPTPTNALTWSQKLRDFSR